MEEGRQQNAGYLNASAAAERLQRNVNREHFLCTDFLLAFWQVITCLNASTCCSSTWCAYNRVAVKFSVCCSMSHVLNGELHIPLNGLNLCRC